MTRGVVMMPDDLDRLDRIEQAMVELRRDVLAAVAPPRDKELKTKDAAKRLSMHRDTLLEKVRTGEIKAVKRGVWYFKESDLMAYIEGRRK